MSWKMSQARAAEKVSESSLSDKWVMGLSVTTNSQHLP